jgi:hypothetical protein
MRISASLVVLVLVPALLAAADPPTATVTGRNNGHVVTFEKGMATIVQGLAIATLGSAQFEFAADKDRWDTALKGDHVLVKFAQPQGLAANIQDGGKTYAVSELLVPTTLGTIDAPLARAGDKYWAFGKWDPSPIVLLRDRWGIGRSVQP